MYATAIALAGATRRTVPLRFPDYRFTEDDLRAARPYAREDVDERADGDGVEPPAVRRQ